MGAPTAGSGVRLALDHHYSTAIAVQLRRHGHDAVASVERGWERHEDESLLSLCLQERRALLTNSVSDFVTIVRRWAIEGRGHAGLIFSSDASMPRGRHAVGRYVTALDSLLARNPADLGFAGQVHWL